MFYPIFDAVRDAFQNKPLLPAYNESDDKSSVPLLFTSGREPILARSNELRNLLSGNQLADLYGIPGNLCWISEAVTADRTPTFWKYLREAIEIDELDPEAFVRRIEKEFLERQTDEWLVSFYGFLLAQRAWLRNLERLRESEGTPKWRRPISLFSRSQLFA